MNKISSWFHRVRRNNWTAKESEVIGIALSPIFLLMIAVKEKDVWAFLLFIVAAILAALLISGIQFVFGTEHRLWLLLTTVYLLIVAFFTGIVRKAKRSGY